MNPATEFAFRAVLIGAGATAAIDLWAAVLRRFGVPSLDLPLLGRWVGHLPRGRFVHPAIARAAPVRREPALGWAAHYATGIGFASLLLAMAGLEWAHAPRLAPAMAVGLGTAMVSAGAGNNKAFGVDRAANPWSDIPMAEVLILAGANCAETFPILNKFLWQQRDNGGRWIVVDPRETATARQGDLHLQLRPGTDVAVANGILNVIIREGLIDQEFIAENTKDWEKTRKAAEKCTPEIDSQISGVPAEKIVKAGLMYGRAKTGMRSCMPAGSSIIRMALTMFSHT